VARRGFFAELQHQKQLAEKRRQHAAWEVNRQHAAAIRAAEQAQRLADRARSDVVRARVADREREEREAQRLHEEAMRAEATSRNAHLAKQYEEIDSILSATLGVDDFMDLEDLRTIPQHPPFDRSDLEQETPAPPRLVAPPKPIYVEPQHTTQGLGGLFGGAKHHAEQVAQAQADFAEKYDAWQAAVNQLPAMRLKQMQEHQAREQHRLETLNHVRQAYEAECQQREAEARDANRELDKLISGLAANVDEAVQEYISIVLSRSVYPECFPVSHAFEFDSDTRELSLTVTVPTPADVPSVKEYKYTKAKDEIRAITLSQKNREDRYASAVWRVALRTLHEVFEADRDERIQTIALRVGVERVDAATGRPKPISLVTVASDRASFATVNLGNVVPLAALQHLEARVSKNPFQLLEIDTSKDAPGS
jgi:restriction system protein